MRRHQGENCAKQINNPVYFTRDDHTLPTRTSRIHIQCCTWNNNSHPFTTAPKSPTPHASGWLLDMRFLGQQALEAFTDTATHSPDCTSRLRREARMHSPVAMVILSEKPCRAIPYTRTRRRVVKQAHFLRLVKVSRHTPSSRTPKPSTTIMMHTRTPIQGPGRPQRASQES
jgi:hypothetical protein